MQGVCQGRQGTQRAGRQQYQVHCVFVCVIERERVYLDDVFEVCTHNYECYKQK